MRARPSLVSLSSSFAGGSMFPPSLWRSRESLAGNGREPDSLKLGGGGTQAPRFEASTDWMAAEFVRHLHRGAAEVDNSPLLSCSLLFYTHIHLLTPQHPPSPTNFIYPADEGTLKSPHILIESSTMSFGKLYSYPVCTACDFTPPLLRGAVNHSLE